MNTDVARQQMVKQQVRTFDVFDPRILELLGELPRDQFVDKRFRELAYADTEIPIGHGQKMMTPLVEGRLLQALQVDVDDSVLEIGTGSGFVCACLATLAESVVSIELYDDLLMHASDRLRRFELNNVDLFQMDASDTLPDGAFDVIAVTASLPEFDERYLELLKPGGRLFVIVGEGPSMDAQLVRSDATSETTTTGLFETVVAPLINAKKSQAFSF